MFTLIQKGGPLMYPLILCSFISLTFIIERAIFWLRTNTGKDKTLLNDIYRLAENGNFEQVQKRSAKSKDYIVRTISKTLENRGGPLEKNLEINAHEELSNMRKFMPVLDTIVTLAPLIGITGTVVGIIISFNVLGGSVTEDPTAVTGGIAQALITTAAGLIIAMTTLVPYNYFQTRIDKAARVMENYLNKFEIICEKNGYHKTDSGELHET